LINVELSKIPTDGAKLYAKHQKQSKIPTKKGNPNIKTTESPTIHFLEIKKSKPFLI
jgi:hypothetical protein